MTTEGLITWRNGVRDVSPIILGIVPFGLIFGVTAAATDVDQLAAWASSFLIFAGVSQLAVVEIIGTGGIAVTALLTAIVLNSRHLMYSADMGRYIAGQPLKTKIGIAYLLTDQTYLISSARFPDPDNSEGLASFYFGAALTLWSTWQIATTTGFLLGNFIPRSWELGFAIPLTFLALLILAVKSRPGLVAAVVGGSVAVAAIGLPFGLGLMCGAAAGVVAGVISEKWLA
jgi:predicted branched-subunit amino acid permease